MGYMRHHLIAVTDYGYNESEEALKAAHAKAVELFGGLVSPIIESAINCHHSFTVIPDGSKEGWDDSNKFDAKRDELIELLRQTSLDWVEVQYGDDDMQNIVTRHSDEAHEEAK